MNKGQQLAWLIRSLAPGIMVPQTDEEKWRLFRALVNVRAPGPVSEEFLTIQDMLLKQELARKGVTELAGLTPVSGGLYLWQGDITTLKVDAIVNAANSGMTGCYCPNHRCIDNAIHTFAGVQLRNECAAIMEAQGFPEPVGQAKLTPAYNLPSKYVLHTVGPYVDGAVTRRHQEQLASCYRACLDLAIAHRLESVAFCCISTGEFHFPRELAAEIAVRTVREPNPPLKVVFDVFADEDARAYRSLLNG